MMEPGRGDKSCGPVLGIFEFFWTDTLETGFDCSRLKRDTFFFSGAGVVSDVGRGGVDEDVVAGGVGRAMPPRKRSGRADNASAERVGPIFTNSVASMSWEASSPNAADPVPPRIISSMTRLASSSSSSSSLIVSSAATSLSSSSFPCLIAPANRGFAGIGSYARRSDLNLETEDRWALVFARFASSGTF